MTILQMLNTVCSNYEGGEGGVPAQEPRLSNFYIDEVDIRKTILAPVLCLGLGKFYMGDFLYQ